MSDIGAIKDRQNSSFLESPSRGAPKAAREVFVGNQPSDRIPVETKVSSELKILAEFDQNKAISETEFTTIFSATTPANMSGFCAEFNRETITVRLEINGTVAFEVRLIDLRKLVDLQSFTIPSGIFLSYKSDVIRLFYSPTLPQTANTSLTVSAKADSGVSDAVYEHGLFQVS